MPEVICRYCHQKTEYVSSAVVYGGRDYGMIYLCGACNAWVGVHKGTDNPLGNVANQELREWRKKAHAAFDPLWRRRMKNGKNKFRARNGGYSWLAKALGVPRAECHIAMMDVELCKRVVEICNATEDTDEATTDPL